MNLFGVRLVLISLLAAEVWCPLQTEAVQQQNQKEDVIVKEGHRVIVVETYDQNGQHNTKVSISPELKQDSSTPGVGKFISGDGYLESTIHGDTHTPKDLICDAFGKCTHKIAQAIGKAKEKVYEAAREAVAHQKEMVHEAKEMAEDAIARKKYIAHEAKEKVEDVYEKAKQTAFQKTHDAKEVAKDTYEKAKESVAEKTQDAKESAKESSEIVRDKAKDAKDIGKTIGKDVTRNVSEQMEIAKEKAKEAKESTEEAETIAGKFMNRAARHVYSPEALSALMSLLNLLGFATAYGMCVWVTFVSSYVLAGALARQQFGVVQSKIYPVYFMAMAYSIGLALLGHFIGRRQLLLTSRAEMFQVYILLAAISVVLLNAFYLEPLATKVMFERMKIEKEEGRGRDSPTAETSSRGGRRQPVTGTMSPIATQVGSPAPVAENPVQEETRSRIVRMNWRLKRLNAYSSFLNILSLLALTWHLVYLSQCLHVAC